MQHVLMEGGRERRKEKKKERRKSFHWDLGPCIIFVSADKFASFKIRANLHSITCLILVYKQELPVYSEFNKTVYSVIANKDRRRARLNSLWRRNISGTGKSHPTHMWSDMFQHGWLQACLTCHCAFNRAALESEQQSSKQAQNNNGLLSPLVKKQFPNKWQGNFSEAPLT